MDIVLKVIKYIDSLGSSYAGVAEAYVSAVGECAEVMFRWQGLNEWIHIKVAWGRRSACEHFTINGWMAQSSAMEILNESRLEYVYYKGDAYV